MTYRDYAEAQAEYERQQAAKRAEEMRRAREQAENDRQRREAELLYQKEQEARRAAKYREQHGQPKDYAEAEAMVQNLSRTGGQLPVSPGVTQFVPATNWQVSSRNADGQPASYIAPNGVTYFAPGSTMYQLGWRVSDPNKVRGDLTPAEKAEFDKIRKEFDYLTSRSDRLTPDELKRYKELAGKLGEYDLLSKQRGRGWIRNEFVPAEKGGLTLGKYTVTKKQAAKLKELSEKKDWEGVFQYQKSLGMIQPGELSPNQRIRISAELRTYLLPSGQYDWDLLIKQVAGGKTKLSFNDLAMWFGKETSNQIKKAAKDYTKQSGRVDTGAEWLRDFLAISDDKRRAAIKGWEKNTLPNLPIDLQNEYFRAKKLGETALKSGDPGAVMIYERAMSKFNKNILEYNYGLVKGTEYVNQFYAIADDKNRAILAPFKNKDGTYDLRKALIAGNQSRSNRKQLAIIGAIDAMFSPEITAKLRQKYQALFVPGYEGGYGKNELQASVPPALVAVLGGTKQTPVPHDDLAVGAIVASIWGTTKAVEFIRNWKNNHGGKNPQPEDLVLLETDKGVTHATFIDPERFRQLAGLNQLVPPDVPIVERTEVKADNIPPYTGTQLKPKVFDTSIPGFKGKQNEIIILPTPMNTKEAGDNYLLAATATKTAEIKTVDALKEAEKVLTGKQAKEARKAFNDLRERVKSSIPVDYQYLRRLERLHEKEATSIARNIDVRKANQLWKQYLTAYQEYLVKARLLAEARSVFIASSAPEAFKLNTGQREALAALVLSRYIKAGTYTDLDGLADSAVKHLAKVYEKAYQNALALNLTNAQASTRANTAVNESIDEMQRDVEKSKPQEAIQAKPLTKTQTASKTVTSEATKPLTRTNVKTNEATTPHAVTAERTVIREAELTDTFSPNPTSPFTPLKIPSGDRKDKKDWTPAEVKGAIKWKDGFTIFAIKAPYRRGVDENAWNINNPPPRP